jgi:nifR3 family TIM-barrel protein
MNPIAPMNLLRAGKSLPAAIVDGLPYTALAPMQDVTDLPFMQLLGEYGAPDLFFTEYFRVHGHSTLEAHILESILQHGTGRPVFAQMIGENLFDLERTARELQKHPIAGVDLNMGCPAPKVYKKCVGGGLLRDVPKIRKIFACLRQACNGRFTVKMRIGFDETDIFPQILELVNEFEIDLLSVHGRTVKQMYRGEVDYANIRLARESVDCPVLANGNITSARKAKQVLDFTGCAGVMIGRSAIRNPWIFRQCREYFQNQPLFEPKLKDVRSYIEDLWRTMDRPALPERSRLNRMKKFLNFVGQGVDEDGMFLYEMRRTTAIEDFFKVCDRHLIENNKCDLPFAAEPHPGVVARPNHES